MPYINIGKERYLFSGHRAIVRQRSDDSSISNNPHRGRIKVEIPYLQDEEDSGKPYQFWADYCGPSHQFFSVPDVGTEVFVMFNGGDPHQPIWLGAINTGERSKDPPSRFKRDVPDVSGYESLAGHFLEFDDISGERHIRLQDLAGNYILMDTEANDLEAFFANDGRLTIGNNYTETIGNNLTESIGNNRVITVANDDTLTVSGGNKTVNVDSGSWANTVTGPFSLIGQSSADMNFQTIQVTSLNTITVEATGQIQIKNPLFEATLGTSSVFIGSAGANISLSGTTVSITAGGVTLSLGSTGANFTGSSFVLGGINHITHKHFVFQEGQNTGVPVP